MICGTVVGQFLAALRRQWQWSRGKKLGQQREQFLGALSGEQQLELRGEQPHSCVAGQFRHCQCLSIAIGGLVVLFRLEEMVAQAG